MTRNERTIDSASDYLIPLLCAAVALVMLGGGFDRSQCSDRGTGTLTRVFGLHSETSVLWLHYKCADGSWREEASFVGNPTEDCAVSMIVRFADWQNKMRKGE
ncbi:MAG: hypothetical protein O7D91_17685 [Planctomycetota bacterium]|nr:hypothetical protein [Planctomycetota bacterium]